jgi:hypothetical protein
MLKSISEIGPLFNLSEVRQVSRDLHCVMSSGCYWQFLCSYYVRRAASVV